LSYVPESYPFFNDSSLGLIRLTIETLQKISREKILRVAFACFKNLVDVSSSAIEEMVDNGLVKTVDLLLKGNLKDQDVIDDVRYVGDILEKNMKILTSFEKYVKELLA
jgi:V-type H+-transporting ATPase subunit H